MHRRSAVIALVVWAALVVGSVLLVQRLRWLGRAVKLDAPPLHATPDVRVTGYLLVAVVIGGALVWWLPTAARRLSWPTLLVVGAGSAGLLAVVLATVHHGPHGLVEPLLGRYEYLEQVPAVRAPGPFLDGFADAVRAREYSVHVHGHPPLFLLVLWGLDRIGLGGADPAAVLVIAVGTLVVPATLVAAREVVSEDFARRALPFVVIAPAWVWVATSADAFFAGVSAVAVACVVIATGRRDRSGDAAAVAGGLLFGVSAFLSYGLPLVALVPTAVAVARRRVRPLLLAAIGAACVVAGFLAAGFWWLDGLAATRERYFAGVATIRGYPTFVVANLGILAIALGPALAVGLARLGDRRADRRAWVLVGGALLAVAVADLTGMSRGEVERIWLPFMPWILLAGAALATTRREARRWLTLQLATALVIEVVVRTAW